MWLRLYFHEWTVRATFRSDEICPLPTLSLPDLRIWLSLYFGHCQRPDFRVQICYITQILYILRVNVIKYTLSVWKVPFIVQCLFSQELYAIHIHLDYWNTPNSFCTDFDLSILPILCTSGYLFYYSLTVWLLRFSQLIIMSGSGFAECVISSLMNPSLSTYLFLLCILRIIVKNTNLKFLKANFYCQLHWYKTNKINLIFICLLCKQNNINIFSCRNWKLPKSHLLSVLSSIMLFKIIHLYCAFGIQAFNSPIINLLYLRLPGLAMIKTSNFTLSINNNIYTRQLSSKQILIENTISTLFYRMWMPEENC